MEIYSFLRALADSWGLLAMVLAFLGVIVFAFRPGSRALHADIAQIPLREDPNPNDGTSILPAQKNDKTAARSEARS